MFNVRIKFFTKKNSFSCRKKTRKVAKVPKLYYEPFYNYETCDTADLLNIKNGFFEFNHYEDKLCILCIVSGIRNRPKSDLLRNSLHCYFSLIFFAILDSTIKYLKDCTAQNQFINMQNFGTRNHICGNRTVCGNHKQIIRQLYS